MGELPPPERVAEGIFRSMMLPDERGNFFEAGSIDVVQYIARGPIRSFDELHAEARRNAVLLHDGITVGEWPDSTIEAMQWHRFARAEKIRREGL